MTVDEIKHAISKKVVSKITNSMPNFLQAN